MARRTVYAVVFTVAVAIFVVARVFFPHDGIGGEHLLLFGLPSVTWFVERMMLWSDEDVYQEVR